MATILKKIPLMVISMAALRGLYLQYNKAGPPILPAECYPQPDLVNAICVDGSTKSCSDPLWMTKVMYHLRFFHQYLLHEEGTMIMANRHNRRSNIVVTDTMAKDWFELYLLTLENRLEITDMLKRTQEVQDAILALQKRAIAELSVPMDCPQKMAATQILYKFFNDTLPLFRSYIEHPAFSALANASSQAGAAANNNAILANHTWTTGSRFDTLSCLLWYGKPKCDSWDAAQPYEVSMMQIFIYLRKALAYVFKGHHDVITAYQAMKDEAVTLMNRVTDKMQEFNVMRTLPKEQKWRLDLNTTRDSFDMVDLSSEQLVWEVGKLFREGFDMVVDFDSLIPEDAP